MTLRRLPHLLVTVAPLAVPLAAVAQPIFSGSVTTAPSSAAPTLGMPALALLVMVLAGGGACFLRRAARGAIARVGFMVALTALAGLAYAVLPHPPGTATIAVEGDQCTMQTVQAFDPANLNTLVNQCPNKIWIVAIEVSCADPPVTTPCRVGQVLATGETCMLPGCV